MTFRDLRDFIRELEKRSDRSACVRPSIPNWRSRKLPIESPKPQRLRIRPSYLKACDAMPVLIERLWQRRAHGLGPQR